MHGCYSNFRISDFYHEFGYMSTSGIIIWLCFHVLLINKFKVKVVENSWREQFAHNFYKSLSQTNSFSSKERSKTHRVSLLSIRRQIKRIRGIKPLRKILQRSLPFFRVSLQMQHINIKAISLPQRVLTNFAILSQTTHAAINNRRFNSQTLHKACVISGESVQLLEFDHILKI